VAKGVGGVKPYMDDGDLVLYCGDALDVVRELPSESVHMVVTSPPFFGLRDYQVEGQIGLEESPGAWAQRLVEVFRPLRERVLRRDGTLWCEVGDGYAATRSLKPKDLIGAPWLLAFALRADGWYLRSCSIWHKPNPMPESVTDRPTTSHSYVFLLAKSASYFYDAEAVREPAEWARWGDQTVPKHEGTATAAGWMRPRTKTDLQEGDGCSQRNLRSVWTIPTEPNGLAVCAICDAYWERGAPREHCGKRVVAHYAAFPQALVERCIKAGTSERGVCPECGAPWVREIAKEVIDVPGGSRFGAGTNTKGKGGDGRVNERAQLNTQTLGWRPSCECLWLAGEMRPIPKPATVLDPFSGSGTTLLVTRRLGRRGIGAELNECYCRMSRHRLAQLSLLGVA
jgi:DNA modification methylase